MPSPEPRSTVVNGPKLSIHLSIYCALLLDGMASTEMASVDLPWFDMVRWTSDFVTAELRPHWSEDDWQTYTASTADLVR